MGEIQDILNAVRSVNAETWQHAAGVWGSMAGSIYQTQGSLDTAWNNTPVFRGNTPETSAAFGQFEREINASRESTNQWGWFGRQVEGKLRSTAGLIPVYQGIVEAKANEYAAAQDDGARNRALEGARLARDVLGRIIENTFLGTATPDQPYRGPMTRRPDDASTGGDDPNAQGGGAGDGTGAGGSAGGGAGAGDGSGDKSGKPGDAPKGPEAKDPVEEAGKFIDVVGKGIDLLGKPADVAGKYVSLAQQVKDLLGQGGAGTEGLNPEDLLPEGWDPETPSLAGGAGAAPTFDPGKLTDPGPIGSGAGGSALGGIGAGGLTGTPDRGVPPLRSATAGVSGAEPSLAGRTASASPAGAQQMMPPMYPPPMGGMGAAGNGGRGDIRPGAAPSRPGFSVPTEQSESERLSRNGVQADLQGRTSGEPRATSAVPPLRKRKGHTRNGGPSDRDVLDEELWRV